MLSRAERETAVKAMAGLLSESIDSEELASSDVLKLVREFKLRQPKLTKDNSVLDKLKCFSCDKSMPGICFSKVQRRGGGESADCWHCRYLQEIHLEVDKLWFGWPQDQYSLEVMVPIGQLSRMYA